MSKSAGSFSRSARRGAQLGAAAAVLVVIGVASAFLGLVAPFHGFLLMVLGLAAALAGLVTSLVGVHRTRPHLGRQGRGHALRGVGLSAVVLAIVLFPGLGNRSGPRINDITTDLDEPPSFVSAASVPANAGRDMAHPGEDFAEQQRRAYPDIAPLLLDDPPSAAFDKVRAALASMPRMKITDEDRESGRIEATETSALFHFADDVVVRIRADGDGSRVDVRSKSRDGKGDMGVNARRIRELLARVREAAAER